MKILDKIAEKVVNIKEIQETPVDNLEAQLEPLIGQINQQIQERAKRGYLDVDVTLKYLDGYFHDAEYFLKKVYGKAGYKVSIDIVGYYSGTLLIIEWGND